MGIRQVYSSALIIVIFISYYGCTTSHKLEVNRHTNSTLTGAEADSIMADMSRILQISNGTNDTACKVRFSREGNISTFTTANGIINSSADFNAIESEDGNVKVVNQINWCGSLLPNVIGCARTPGSSMAVVRFTGNQEGVLWAHEFGHNKGLAHRDSVNAVMRSFIGLNHRIVNKDECTAFKSN